MNIDSLKFFKPRYLVIVGVLVFFAWSAVVLAVPPGSPYLPGETLDPSCTPTGASSTNCTVLPNGLISSVGFVSLTTSTDQVGIGATSSVAKFFVQTTSVGTTTALFSGMVAQTADILQVASSSGMLYFQISSLGIASSSEFRTPSSTIISLTFTNATGSGSFAVTGSGNNSGTPAIALTGTPQATTTISLAQLGSAIAGGSANGTYLGANSASGFAGNFLDLQVNGTSKFSVSGAGFASSSQLYANSSTIQFLFDASGNKYSTSTGGRGGIVTSTPIYLYGIPFFVNNNSSTVVTNAGLIFNASSGALTVGSSSLTNVSSTNIDIAGYLRAGSINVVTSSVTSALRLADASGADSAYGGAAACAWGNAITTLSAVGGSTCVPFGSLTTSTPYAANGLLYANAANTGVTNASGTLGFSVIAGNAVFQNTSITSSSQLYANSSTVAGVLSVGTIKGLSISTGVLLGGSLAGSNTGYDFKVNNTNSRTLTSGGDSGALQIQSGSTNGFNPTSGASTYEGVNIAILINQTATASGVTRSLYISPTITSAADHRAIEVSTSSFTLASSSANSLTWNLIGVPTYLMASSTKSITASAFTIAGAPTTASTTAQSLTLTSSTALAIQGSAVSSTNAYSLYVDAPFGATNNYAAFFNSGLVSVSGIASTSQLYANSSTITGLRFTNATGTTLTLASSSVFINGTSTLIVCAISNCNVGTNASNTNTVAWFASTDGTQNTQSITARGQISAGAADIGEYINVVGPDSDYSAGDILSVSANASGTFEKSVVAYDQKLAGVVTVTAGLVAGGGLDAHGSKVIALAGRVPIKVTGKNGPIAVGDYITSSDIPGYGMKATQSGKVLAIAMDAWNGTTAAATGTLLAFINPHYEESLDGSAIPANVGITIDSIGNLGDVAVLSTLLNRETQIGTSSISESFSDLVTAGLEVITPKLLANNFSAKNSAIVGGDVDIGGNLSVHKGLLIAGLPSGTAASINELGDAMFAGNVGAAKIIAGSIESPSLAFLADGISVLSSTVAGLSSTTALLSSSTVDMENRLAMLGNRIIAIQSSTPSVDIRQLLNNQGALSLNSILILGGGLEVNTINSTGGLITFMNDVAFFGRPYFNSDTGGFVKISQGATFVNVMFDQEYLEQPVVSVTITLDSGTSTLGADLANIFFSNDVRFLVTDKTTKGFTVRLNKQAPSDITLSWIALAVKNAKLFNSPGIGASGTDFAAEIFPQSSSTPTSSLINTATTTVLFPTDATATPINSTTTASSSVSLLSPTGTTVTASSSANAASIELSTSIDGAVNENSSPVAITSSATSTN